MSDVIDLLADLSNAFAPPGKEDEVRDILKRELEDYADDIKIDRLGNIIFYHYSKENFPCVMISSHMDEVAFLTTYIEDEGFLRFHVLGGIPITTLPGQRILLKGADRRVKGIIGTKPPHLMKEEERKQPIPQENLFIDVGAGSIEEVNELDIDIGSTGVFDVNFERLDKGYLMGKAFDDRAGCAVLVEVFKAIKELPCNLVAVGTVQEEVGLRGARTAAWQIDPDFGLALEGTFAADVPGSRPNEISSKIKGGPVVTIVDRATITHPKVLETLVGIGKEKLIPFQFKKVPSGGTDAGAIHLTKAGVPSGTVAVPCRYIHSPASVAHIDDLNNAIKLTFEFVKRISSQ
jgi:putative aminopeptidase FrvX